VIFFLGVWQETLLLVSASLKEFQLVSATELQSGLLLKKESLNGIHILLDTVKVPL